MSALNIIVNASILSLHPDMDASKYHNLKLLSIANDYEEESWRYNQFNMLLWDHIGEATLSARERKALINQPGTFLSTAAKKLKLIDTKKRTSSSEIAEILLYAIMKIHFKALSVVPKIFYKQNTNDPAKGADSVHINIIDKDKFNLWLGEAKFYSDISTNRFNTIIDSVESMLSKDKIHHENSIVCNVSDLDSLDLDPNLLAEIKSKLSPDTPIDTVKEILNIPILILYQCDITQKGKSFNAEYKKEIEKLHKEKVKAYIEKQHEKLNKIHNYFDIQFHLIIYPVPLKDTVVENFKTSADYHRNQ